SAWVFFLPIPIILLFLLTLGISLTTSALYAYYMDVRYIVDAGLLVWFYACPIFYTMDMVPPALVPYYQWNPMAGILVAFQNIIIKNQAPDFDLLLLSAVICFVVLALGVIIFERSRGDFTDVI
ncbi:MAG: hypothetical protein HQK60_10595, partial [Deltaproteobacteria bacterium]|nr:hypothetical protein [Deltaproteobacteria bacterium]